MSAVKVAKAALRTEIEKKLALLSPEERRRQSKIVVEKLFSLPKFKEAKNVSVYLSMDNEIDTEPIVRKLFEQGKGCFVPRYRKAGMEMVKLRDMEDWENLPLTKWNIKQPYLKDERENALDAGLDLLVVPGVAFTKDGLRLGHGAGYYDKYQRKLRDVLEVPPTSIAVGFKEQIVDEVPIEDTDVTVDLVLYDD
ncbi:5-formyltetrahydrofolate cyclo-ligase isoform X2 [Anoplophora glabripennis]|uniref:5-formyltetrahydrofolate cyclo-ligase isoform X2 n=1 Tax=Anoplophora glabripennis TaxID=217634 RepID=UPI0008758D97|nr:5-formyltetrahydrofolate cyclo-ligase isoform X2 [Anoplophora glabripennis]